MSATTRCATSSKSSTTSRKRTWTTKSPPPVWCGNLSEEILLRRLNSLFAVSFELRQKIKRTLSEEIVESDTVTPEVCELSENRDGLMSGLAGFMVFDELMTDCSDEKDNSYDEKLEAEMNPYCLEDWQKELVRNGSYDVWSFDEEELEEDDYYFEDDE